MTTACTYPDCTKPARARGLCEGHYSQQRRGKPLTPLGTRTTPGGPCTHPDCNHIATIKSLCDRHYRQTHYNGTAQAQPGQLACAIPGCGRVTKANGLCNKHDLRRRRKAGMKPRPDRPARPRTQGQTPQRADRSALPAGWARRAKAKRPSPTPKVLAAEISLRPITPEEAHEALLCLRRHGALDLAEALGLSTHPDGVAA